MRYTAQVGGASWTSGPIIACETLSVARQVAEGFGTTADWCEVRDVSTCELVAMHRRHGEEWRPVPEDELAKRVRDEREDGA